MNEQLLARLDEADLAEEVGWFVMAAAMGDDALADALGGDRPARPESAALDAVDPPQLFLADVAVEGFRGVGPAATLNLSQGCGLTLVVGRNGSGKSSFAEAAELALTGTSQRWVGKPKSWQGGWANLHHKGPRKIVVRLRTDGEEGFTRVESRWPQGAALDDRVAVAVLPTGAEASVESLGLAPAFETWRPFLSYEDLGSLLDATPSSIYDRLSVLLGLEDWVEVEQRLRAEAKTVADLVKTADAGAKSLRATLAESDDDRAKRALTHLPAKGPWDIEELDELATGTAAPDADIARLNALAELTAPDTDRIAELVSELRSAAALVEQHAGTDADQAGHLAALIAQAIEYQASHRDGETCPVCGTHEVLDDAWMTDATTKVDALKARAAEVTQATKTLEDRLRDARSAVLAVPTELIDPPAGVETEPLLRAWHAWAELPDREDLGAARPLPQQAATALALADHLESWIVDLAPLVPLVVEQAKAERDRRQDRWRPIAEEIAAWLEDAPAAQAQRPKAAQLKEAAAWVAAEAVAVREERFRPIADQVRAAWDQLRHDSNVTIDDLALDGAATRRRLALRVSVDDTSTEGMSVLSQGELNALSLALFLPRATHDDSPFRFVMIDDPVQALDAARVDGLARVLQDVAKTRQVVVFTHDERLPDACRRLAIAARVLEVSRGERSALTIRSMADPSDRYLGDARAIAASDPYPAEARRRVVPGLCRQALEAVSIDLGRQRLFARGVPFAEIEAEVAGLTTLFTHLAFGLFGDGSQKDVYQRLNAIAPKGLHPVELVRQLNKGTHDGSDRHPHAVIDETQALIAALRARI